MAPPGTLSPTAYTLAAWGLGPRIASPADGSRPAITPVSTSGRLVCGPLNGLAFSSLVYPATSRTGAVSPMPLAIARTTAVASPERAYQIAAEASAAPGKGGAPLNMPIEVREVMSAPPVEV